VRFQIIRSLDGASLEELVIQATGDMELLKTDCRGQAYDDASYMTGIYSGLQALKSLNSLAEYVLCANHSLIWLVLVLPACRVLHSQSSTHRWSIPKTVV